MHLPKQQVSEDYDTCEDLHKEIFLSALNRTSDRQTHTLTDGHTLLLVVLLLEGLFFAVADDV